MDPHYELVFLEANLEIARSLYLKGDYDKCRERLDIFENRLEKIADEAVLNSQEMDYLADFYINLREITDKDLNYHTLRK